MSKFEEIVEILNDFRGTKQAAVTVHRDPAAAKSVASDDNYVPIGVRGIMAASEKLLAVNRGLLDTDERDSLAFKQVMTQDRLFRERVAMDASKSQRMLLRNAARRKNLSGAMPFIFDKDAEGMLIGNSLASPLEEINPIQLVEQKRRVTQMGPGGIGSEQAITADMQNIHPSQFGYLSPLEGPESARIGIDSRLAWGVRVGNDGKLYQRFRNKRTGKYEWLSPSQMHGKVIKLPD